MFFKREDILKIHNALLQLRVKDSELPNAEPVTYDDTLSIVQEGKNKQIGIKDFFNQISLWKKEDFINITDEYDKYNISLLEAINLVPTLQRKNGLVITFQDEKGFVYNINNKTLSINLDEICYILTNKVVTSVPSYNGKFVGEMMFNSTSAILYIWDGSRWLHYYPTGNGATDARPSLTSQNKGFEYYDTTLNKKILWNGATWVNLDGSSLNIKKSGTTAERPSNVEIGFIYKDTTLNKLILWEGSKWVNLDGTELS